MLIGRRKMLQAAALSAAPLCATAFAESTPSPKDAYVYIISPQDGQRIRGPFFCRFGLRNMGIAPAGNAAPNSGHHHLFIDVDEPLNAEIPIPADRNHLHYGAGQTETRLELPPGPHTLQLVLGDAGHVPFNPSVVSHKIRIMVVR